MQGPMKPVSDTWYKFTRKEKQKLIIQNYFKNPKAMSTRSTVKFYNEFDQEQPILSVYQQYDGYIEGVGHELATWLKDKKVINGISGQTMQDGYANGMGCLAAQYVAAKKDRIGGFYLTSSDDEQNYNYTVRMLDEKLIIEVDDIFKGTPEELLNFKEHEE